MRQRIAYVEFYLSSKEPFIPAIYYVRNTKSKRSTLQLITIVANKYVNLSEKRMQSKTQATFCLSITHIHTMHTAHKIYRRKLR